jgi:hypothetical protein
MTSAEISEKMGAALRTVNNWASLNGVNYIGEGRRKTYIWTSEDMERFASRRGKGWEKGKPRK